MASLKEDIDSMANWVSEALKSSGYRADFSPNSLAEIERFFSEQVKNGVVVEGGFLSEEVGTRLFAIGSYCGEVLRREIGGEWITDDNDPQGELNVSLQLANAQLCWPVQRVMKRFNSSEGNIVFWANELGSGVLPE